MLTTCPKCHQLYEALESEGHHPGRRCPRCVAIEELLAAADELNARVRAELGRSRSRVSAVVMRAGLEPLLDRTERAVEKARAAT